MESKQDCLEVPSLGRPFQLGMLYDCRSDKIIPGITLWDPDLLKKNIDTQAQKSSNYQVISEDTVESKTNAMNINASLKASFLSGLITVSGSASYLDNRKSSKSQARITLQYSMKSRYDQLTMAHLAYHNVAHPNVFESGNATHVVTGILYGADAFFIFDRHISKTEEERTVGGELEAAVKGIPYIDISGSGKVKIDSGDVGATDKFHCTFYGDFRLEKNPYTFQEAVEVYRALPSYLGNNDTHVVPKLVWLYPLQNLDSKAARLVREISVGLVNGIQEIIEGFHDLKLIANDLRTSDTFKYFTLTKRRIDTFITYIDEYLASFKKTILPILPRIRGGTAEEIVLAQIIQSHKASIFSAAQLYQWLDLRAKEDKQLSVLLSTFEAEKLLVSSENLCELTSNLDIDQVLSFNFQLDTSRDLFLQSMCRALEGSADTRLKEAKLAADSWSQSEENIRQIFSMGRHFLEFRPRQHSVIHWLCI